MFKKIEDVLLLLPRTSATATPARYAWMFVSGRQLRFNGRIWFGNIRRHRQWVYRCAGVSRGSEPVPSRARWRPTLRSNWIAPFNRHTHLQKQQLNILRLCTPLKTARVYMCKKKNYIGCSKSLAL